ncbi:MAG: choice-of-anchor D domain-containing protein [Chloroflexota bacterium]
MKKLLYAFFAFTFLSSFSAFAQNEVIVPPSTAKLPKLDKTQAEGKYYLIFDNLDVVKDGSGTTISNAFDLLYWDGLKNYPSSMDDYQKYFVRAPFSDATLNAYNIPQEFDVLVIPVGDYPLNIATSTNGKKLITLIKEMLSAGKSVFISGRHILKWAFASDAQFAQGKDPEVQTWLTSDVGIDKIAFPPVVQQNGNQLETVGYKLLTKQGDPVGKGYEKYMNMIFTTQDNQEHHPMTYYTVIDVVTAFKDGSKAIPVDHINSLTTPMGYMSLRGEIGGGKLALYFYGYENSAGHPSGAVPPVLQLPMDWFVSGLPKNEPYLKAESYSVEFGAVKLNETKQGEFRFQNFSRKPLIISKVELAGQEPAGSFTLVHGALPLTIQPGAYDKIIIKFKPTVERDYSEILSVTSNASNEVVDIDLTGNGGEIPTDGPRISSIPELNFENVEFGSKKDMELTITNTGKAILDVQEVELRDNNKNAFTIIAPSPLQTPFGLGPNESKTITIRFVPGEKNATYTARVYYKNNDPTKNDYFVNITGASSESGSSAILEFDMDTVQFGKVKPNFSQSKSVVIRNTGTAVLNINMIAFEANDLGIFELVDPKIAPGTKVAIGDSVTFKVRFKPDEETTYNERIMVQTNAKNATDGVIYLNLQGTGSFAGVNEPIASSQDGSIVLKAIPHPISGNGSIVCEIKREMAGNLEVFVIDMAGRRVADLYNGLAAQGSLTLPISSGANASGQYFVIANAGGSSVRLPIIFVK